MTDTAFEISRSVGVDNDGFRYAVVRERDGRGFAFRITDCCDASAKGSMVGDFPAVVCRNCYQVVDPMLGMEPNLTESRTTVSALRVWWHNIGQDVEVVLPDETVTGEIQSVDRDVSSSGRWMVIVTVRDDNGTWDLHLPSDHLVTIFE